MSIKKGFGTHTLVGTSKTTSEIVYGVDETVPKDRCRLVLNGVTCRIRAGCRGICQTHYHRFRKLGTFDLYALPRTRRKNK